MNAFQRGAIRLTLKFVPQLRRLFERTGGTLERLSETVDMYRDRFADENHQISERMAEVREAIAMQSGSWMGVPVLEAGAVVKESGAVVQLRERLAELELALEDRGWKRQLAMADSEFSRYGIQQIILICRLMRIKNPLIQRGILISAFYVFGRGVEVTSEDEAANEVLTEFFTADRNQTVIGHKALVKKECAKFTDGNIFWAFFSDVVDGKTTVRTIDALEITEIVTDPDDSGVPWYYHRRWAQQGFDPKTGIRQPVMQDAWYVALGYTPPAGVTTIAGVKLMKDAAGLFIPVLHDKDGELEKWHFGCPRAYAALDWARASKDLLTDYATRMRALARFAWDVETKGGAPAIANLKQAFATTLANDGTNIEQNPPPVTGSTWISGPGTKLSPIKTAGMQSGPDEGRRLFHMVYMVFGLPETFFADASVGSLATAKSLDRPTELMFKDRQEQWTDTFTRMSNFVLERSTTAPKGRLREASKKDDYTAPAVNVNWPPIVEGDTPELIAAVVEAMTLNGFDPTGIDVKTGMKALLSMVASVSNTDIDIEGVIEEMFPESEYSKVTDRVPVMKAQQEQALMPPPTPTAQPGAEVPGVGAPPHAPQPRKPRPKRVSTESHRVMGQLRQALVALKERK